MAKRDKAFDRAWDRLDVYERILLNWIENHRPLAEPWEIEGHSTVPREFRYSLTRSPEGAPTGNLQLLFETGFVEVYEGRLRPTEYLGRMAVERMRPH